MNKKEGIVDIGFVPLAKKWNYIKYSQFKELEDDVKNVLRSIEFDKNEEEIKSEYQITDERMKDIRVTIIKNMVKNLDKETEDSVERMANMNWQDLSRIVKDNADKLTKAKIWEKPDAEELLQQGKSLEQIQMTYDIYDALPSKSPGLNSEQFSQRVDYYRELVNEAILGVEPELFKGQYNQILNEFKSANSFIEMNDKVSAYNKLSHIYYANLRTAQKENPNFDISWYKEQVPEFEKYFDKVKHLNGSDKVLNMTNIHDSLKKERAAKVKFDKAISKIYNFERLEDEVDASSLAKGETLFDRTHKIIRVGEDGVILNKKTSIFVEENEKWQLVYRWSNRRTQTHLSIDDNENNIQLGDYVIVTKGQYSDKPVPYKTLEEAEKGYEELKSKYLEKTELESVLDKSVSKHVRKQREKFKIDKLTDLEMKGIDFRKGVDIWTKDFQDTFGFTDINIGNWVQNDKHAQQYMNMWFDAFMEIAYINKLDPKFIGEGQKLSIGASGQKGSVGFYETTTNTLQFNKENGAGSGAHEFAHRLHINGISGKISEIKDEQLKKEVKDALKDFENSLVYKDVLVKKDVDKELTNIKEEFNKRCDNIIRYSRPGRRMNDSQLKKLYKKINEVADDYKENPEKRELLLDGAESLREVGVYCKNETGHILSAEDRRTIAQYIYLYTEKYSVVQREGSEVMIREHTDFFKESQEFDKKYSANGKVYWAAPEEMTARFKALKDIKTASEMGISCPAANGHALHSGPVPKGDEYKIIDEKWNRLIKTSEKAGLIKTKEVKETDWIKDRMIEEYPEINETIIGKGVQLNSVDAIRNFIENNEVKSLERV